MPNWHIEFEVTAKCLSDAQAAVHTLRGVSNIGVRPIMERAKREGGDVQNGSIRGHIRTILLDGPRSTEEVFSSLTAIGVKTNMKKTANNLGNMVTSKLARRTKPGFFALTAKGKTYG